MLFNNIRSFWRINRGASSQVLAPLAPEVLQCCRWVSAPSWTQLSKFRGTRWRPLSCTRAACARAAAAAAARVSPATVSCEQHLRRAPQHTAATACDEFSGAAVMSVSAAQRRSYTVKCVDMWKLGVSTTLASVTADLIIIRLFI